ncbi:Alpha/beta hydrolase family protein [Rubripirellula tenax]|uniref:Alpha/beta hydrolase family protein n=1 Tax=Rubripirellula tenax TaxID=2528015 RepID=A0A5C6FG56_9BACT|nr:prolyl oligopeptidase family serine peptidase [Rubripirellula tenax]TWU60766.1 Alpha/beta hydrolase family protein [Rubripirellula tenax]
MVRFLAVVSVIMVTGCKIDFPEMDPVAERKIEMEAFDLSDVPSIATPERPQSEEFCPGVDQYTVRLPVDEGQPGQASEVRVLLPQRLANGPLPDGPLPTLVMNGSGAYLFSGMSLTDEDMEPMIDYVLKGYAVIGYETDGCQPDFENDPSLTEFTQMAKDYVASKAGLVNAKRAIDYAVERFAEIDADNLYSIGHSSGGKQALLLAQHDERIRGVVAFAPACRMDIGSKMTMARMQGADTQRLINEVNRSMPITHASRSKVPMVLFHSRRDQITTSAEVIAFSLVAGKDAVAIEVKASGHGSVPVAAFEESIEWLAKQTGGMKKATDKDSVNDESVAAVATALPAPVSPGVPNAQHAFEATNVFFRSEPNASTGSNAAMNREIEKTGVRINPYANQ